MRPSESSRPVTGLILIPPNFFSEDRGTACAGLSSVCNPVPSIFPLFPLQMSGTSEGGESQFFYETSDENQGSEGSAASSLASHLQGSLKRPRTCRTQIRGKAWILRGDITIPVRHNNSLSDHGDSNVEDELVQMTKLHLQTALGAKFEILFQNLSKHVSFFVIFCNLVHIQHVGPAATEVKIQILGFLQLKQAKAKTALDKLMSSFSTLSHVLQGKWERCDGGLSTNDEYAHCLHTNSSWRPLQSTGVYRESNQAKCAKRIATAQVASYLLSVVFFNTNVEIRKTDPPSTNRRAAQLRRRAPPPPSPPLP